MNSEHVRAFGLLFAANVVVVACAPSRPDGDDVRQSRQAVAVGVDDRVDYLDIDDVRLRRWADAAAGLIGMDTFSCSGETCTFTAPVAPLTHDNSGTPFCDDFRFKGQHKRMYCSAFLVAPTKVVTAGHCICGPGSCANGNNLCWNAKVVFGYRADPNLPGQSPTTIPSIDVYQCVDAIGISNTGDNPPGLPPEDWAIITLDRPVTGRTPLVPQYAGPTGHHELVSIGHSLSIPQKTARDAHVQVDDPADLRYFKTSADVFPAGSGGVIVDVATGMVAGITTDASTPQFALNEADNCLDVHVCDEITGCPGFPSSTRMTWAAQQGQLPLQSGLGQITLAAWGPGRLDAFALRNDGKIWHQALTGESWFPSENGYWELMGPSGSETFSNPPVVVSWGENRLDIFVVGNDGNLYHRAWTGTIWDPPNLEWESLGGAVGGRPSIVAWGPNRLDVFALAATSNLILHKALSGTDWFPSQTGWEAMGGPANGSPVAVAKAANRLDIFVEGTDRSLLHKSWTGSEWLPPREADWSSLGGSFSGPPAAVAWNASRLDVFAPGTDGAIHHRANLGSGWLPPFNWDSLGGSFVGPPTAVSWGENRIDVFALGTDSVYRHGAMVGTEWVTWEGLGQMGPLGLSPVPPALAVTAWGPNRLDIYGRGADGVAYYKSWDGSTWSPGLTSWAPRGGAF
jgi:hypothetical protein